MGSYQVSLVPRFNQEVANIGWLLGPRALSTLLHQECYSGGKSGYSKPQDFPIWNTRSICQWLDDFEDPETTRSHVKLVTLTGAKAKENELLHGELAPIANALYCRLEQPEFEDTSLFPVLVLSLFGPRHGRLLQAKFDNSGVLVVRASPIYDFVDSNKKMELFIRYNNCKPPRWSRDGASFHSRAVAISLQDLSQKEMFFL